MSSAPSTEPSAPSRSAAPALWCSAKDRGRPSVSAAGRRQAMTCSATLRAYEPCHAARRINGHKRHMQCMHTPPQIMGVHVTV